MNKKLSVLILTGTLACTMALPALAVEQMPTAVPTTVAEETQTLPGSVSTWHRAGDCQGREREHHPAPHGL